MNWVRVSFCRIVLKNRPLYLKYVLPDFQSISNACPDVHILTESKHIEHTQSSASPPHTHLLTHQRHRREQVRMQHKRTYIFVCLCVCFWWPHVCSHAFEFHSARSYFHIKRRRERTHKHTHTHTGAHIRANSLEKKSNRIGFPIRITCSVSMCTQVKRKHTCTTCMAERCRIPFDMRARVCLHVETM